MEYGPPTRRGAVTDGASSPGPAPASLRFAEAARRLGGVARTRGLRAPTFRSPPKVVGATRTLHRRDDGSCSVAVLVKGRPWLAVLADMVEGVVAANDLDGVEAGRLRTDLWVVLAEAGVAAA
ncbi:MAG: hypothetical protein RIE08_13395 [Acidimicrobiales bacterium]